MKVTRKQREEIDFLSRYAEVPFAPTEEEVREYLDITVLGVGSMRATIIGAAAAWRTYSQRARRLCGANASYLP